MIKRRKIAPGPPLPLPPSTETKSSGVEPTDLDHMKSMEDTGTGAGSSSTSTSAMSEPMSITSPADSVSEQPPSTTPVVSFVDPAQVVQAVLLGSETLSCGICKSVIPKRSQKFRLESKLRFHANTVEQALTVFFNVNPGRTLELNPICEKCSTLLGAASKNLDKLYARFCGTPVLVEKFSQSKNTVSASCQTDTKLMISSTGTVNKNKTQIETKPKNARQRKAREKVMQSMVRKVIKAEIRPLLREYSATLLDQNRDQLSPANEKIYSDLQLRAPTVLAVLQALGLKGTVSKRRKDLPFNSAMRTMLAVSLRAHNSRCNLFQQMVGLTLWKTRASKQTFLIFQALGISISYASTLNLLDRLGEGCDKELTLWTETHLGIPTNSRALKSCESLPKNSLEDDSVTGECMTTQAVSVAQSL